MSNHSYDDNANQQVRQPNVQSAFATAPQNETDGSSAFSSISANLRSSTHPPLASSISSENLGDKSLAVTSCSSILTVHDHDVLSGRGVNIAHHPGNERFRSLVTSNTDQAYCTSYSVTEKKAVAHQIVKHIKNLDPPGRFLKREGRGAVSRGLDGPWEELSEKDTVKKTCQALRDCNRHDRSGYAEGVSAPVDVKKAVDKASKAGLTVKDRAVAAASTLKSNHHRQDQTYLGIQAQRYDGAVYSPGRSQSRSISKRGTAKSQSAGGKRSRDELDNDYYASVYSSMPISRHATGAQSGPGIHTQYSNANAATMVSGHPSPIHTISHASQKSAAVASHPTANFPDYTSSTPASGPGFAHSSEQQTTQASSGGGYTNHNQVNRGIDPAYHGQHQRPHQNQYQQGQTHSTHGYSYPHHPHPNAQSYPYGYTQNYTTEQYQNPYDPRGYSTNATSAAYQNYPHHSSDPSPYNSMNTGYNHSYNHPHNQFRTVDESWALKKQRTDDTDPSLTSTGVSTSTSGTPASSPLDNALEIDASMSVPTPAVHASNTTTNESMHDFFKEGDDSWTRGPPIDTGADVGGIGVDPNNSMDGGFVDPMEDGLFSFDNDKY